LFVFDLLHPVKPPLAIELLQYRDTGHPIVGMATCHPHEAARLPSGLMPQSVQASRKLLTAPHCSDTVCSMKKSSAKVRGPLTDLENELMRTVWDHGSCSVEAVHQVISRTRSLKEGSTRTLLTRLEQKGYLKHEVKERAYIYTAVEPARSLAARAVRQILDRLCRGSVEELVSGLVESKVLSNTEMDQLERFVRERKARRSK
jgi:BlaI family penicillinase repressor